MYEPTYVAFCDNVLTNYIGNFFAESAQDMKVSCNCEYCGGGVRHEVGQTSTKLDGLNATW